MPKLGTILEVLQEASSQLEKAEIENPRREAELLFCHVCGWKKVDLYCNLKLTVEREVLEGFQRAVTQRCTHLPLAYIVGYRDFFGHRFLVDPAVLIPRPDTEILVEKAIAEAKKQGLSTLEILDLGTGSGNIAISLAKSLPLAKVTAVDISPQALKVAQKNGERLGAGDIHWVESDLFASLPHRYFDLIATNPPYVGTKFGPRPDKDVQAFEPEHALFSGSQGTDHIKKIIEQSPSYLQPGGVLLIELAPFQIERVEAWLQERGFSQTKLIADLQGLPRVVLGRWEG